MQDGETLGLERTQSATGEEQYVETSRAGREDVATSKPQGSVVIESARTKNGKLSFCKNHKIGTWNVRTMNTGKLDIVKREMERTRVEILGISEIKWTEMGHFQSDEYKVFFSGQDHVRRNGVAIICDKDTSRCVMGYKPISDRIISIRVDGHPIRTRFWNGVFSDETIEQSLMRLLNTSWGMTRGRGITDSTLTKWVHALPRCVPICNALDNFTCVQSGTSEQHKDLRPSSERRDNTDLSLFLQWLEAHSPFVDCQPELMVSISTGIVADSSVNCDDVVQVGQTAIAKMMGKTYAKLTLRRKDKVKLFGVMKNTVRVRGEDVVVNPSLLFNRITCILNTSSKLDVFLQYELAPQPPALFVDGQMRKSAKSALGNMVKTMVTCQKAIPDASIFVLDGGHLVHAVVWSKPATYQEVCETYKSYILSRYNSCVTVVFDGYAGPISTKSAEQKRRATRCTPADIVIAPSLPTTTSQNEFLGNGGNKTRLINALTPLLENAGIIVKQAVSDADTLIVETALQRAMSSQVPVVVVGTDTDILVMLVAR